MMAYNYFRDMLVCDPHISETYFYLGHLYECGLGVSKDAKVSLTYFNKGAKLGNADCMNKIGDFYHSGYGVPKNLQESIKWYIDAAEINNT
jgi:TPR repeat protein